MVSLLAALNTAGSKTWVISLSSAASRAVDRKPSSSISSRVVRLISILKLFLDYKYKTIAARLSTGIISVTLFITNVKNTILLLAVSTLFSCAGAQTKNNASVPATPNNWVFIASASKPDNQYAVDIDTIDKPIGFVTYWEARILPSPDKDGASVYLHRQKVMCGTNSIYLLKTLTFDSDGKPVGGFIGADDFLLQNPPDDVEVAIHNIVCSKANQEREQIDTKELRLLSSPPSNNPKIQKSIQNVLAPNKHLL